MYSVSEMGHIIFYGHQSILRSFFIMISWAQDICKCFHFRTLDKQLRVSIRYRESDVLFYNHPGWKYATHYSILHDIITPKAISPNEWYYLTAADVVVLKIFAQCDNITQKHDNIIRGLYISPTLGQILHVDIIY